jgi:RNA recognition motif-containing protein
MFQVSLLNVMGHFPGLFFIASKLIFFGLISHLAGAVKEVRETPLKRHQRFIEFYDVRDAAKALREMNGKEIYGKQVDIEFSRPGGHGKKFFNARPRATSKNSFTTPVFDSTTNLRHSEVATFVSPQPPPLLHRFSSGCSPPNVSPRSFLSETQSSAGKKPSGDPSEGNPIEASIEALWGVCHWVET